jgi:hypothetical protein
MARRDGRSEWGRRRPDPGGLDDHGLDDDGGVWILTGIVLGVLLYAGIVLMYVAGFTTVAPLVVIPPVLIGLIGANSLLGGGRSQGRSPARPAGNGRPAARPAGNGRGPRPSGESGRPVGPGSTLPDPGRPAGEEPRTPT